MNHRITLLKQGAARDAAGQKVDGWGDMGTVWADVRFQSGAEVLRAGTEVVLKRASIRIRTRTDVDESWRVCYQGAEFDVKSVLPDADRSFSLLVVESVP